jgi:hypothetical protein
MLTFIDMDTRASVPYWNSKPPAGGPATAPPQTR